MPCATLALLAKWRHAQAKLLWDPDQPSGGPQVSGLGVGRTEPTHILFTTRLCSWDIEIVVISLVFPCLHQRRVPSFSEHTLNSNYKSEQTATRPRRK